MNKYAVVSTDCNKEYASLLPLTCYSWQKLGYIPIIIDVAKDISENGVVGMDFGTSGMSGLLGKSIVFPISGIHGVKDGSLAQISRLFISCVASMIEDEDIIITSDTDMIIAKDIFLEEDEIVSYGHDLTGFGDLPICYIKASKKKWFELMQTKDNWIESEIEIQLSKKAYSDKWEEYWDVDQKLLTQRAKEYGFDKIKFVNRGHDQSNSGLPQGRWDRHRWDVIPNEIIDVHIKRNDKEAQIKVFQTLFPNDDINWLLEYLKTI